MKFIELATLWKDNSLRRKNIEQRTKEEYWDILNHRVFPAIGDIPVSNLDGFVLDELVTTLMDKGYCTRTISNTICVVRLILKYAYRKGLIESNPLSKMDDLPRNKKEDCIHYFTPAQCKLFLAELDNRNIVYKTMFYVLIYGGLRRGEVCVLRWSDVDFSNGTIHIRRAVSHTHDGLVIKTPKTAAGNRTISLPAACFELLEKLKEMDKSLGIDLAQGQDGYVFKEAKKGNRFVPPQQLTVEFKRIIKIHNRKSAVAEQLPNIRLHDLRHTSATLLISQNVDVETVARRLGHANPSITLNVYAHPTMEGDYRASKVMEEVLAL